MSTSDNYLLQIALMWPIWQKWCVENCYTEIKLVKKITEELKLLQQMLRFILKGRSLFFLKKDFDFNPFFLQNSKRTHQPENKIWKMLTYLEVKSWIKWVRKMSWTYSWQNQQMKNSRRQSLKKIHWVSFCSSRKRREKWPWWSRWRSWVTSGHAHHLTLTVYTLNSETHTQDLQAFIWTRTRNQLLTLSSPTFKNRDLP